MKKLLCFILVLSMFSSFASERTAKIVAGTAAGTSIVVTGVTASYFSGAAIVTGIAWLGGGTLAIGLGVVATVPLIVGGVAYGTYKLFDKGDLK